MNPRADRSSPEARAAVVAAVERRVAAQRELDEATAHLAEAVATARDAGMPIAVAARLAGLTRESMHRLLARHGR